MHSCMREVTLCPCPFRRGKKKEVQAQSNAEPIPEGVITINTSGYIFKLVKVNESLSVGHEEFSCCYFPGLSFVNC